MTPAEKRTFITELCNLIRNVGIERVMDMPVEWGGLELREYLADRFNEQRILSDARDRSYYKKRLAKYTNEKNARYL